MKRTLNIRQQLYQSEISLSRWKSHTKDVGEPQFATIAIYAATMHVI